MVQGLRSYAGQPVTISRREFDAVIFDTDGVVTDTARVHAAAWKRMFDGFLRQWAEREGGAFEPFDADTDYRRHIDGKPRYDGVANFLESRGISIPFGVRDDPPEKETVCGLGNRKNLYFQEHLEEHGVEAFPSTVELVRRLRAAGFKTGIFSASKNCEAVIQAAGVRDLFDAKVDGVDAEAQGLPGKPDPAVLLEAARRLGVSPERSVIVEDAIAGVQAGHAGGFALVIGVNRSDERGVLVEHGATVEVADLAEVTLAED